MEMVKQEKDIKLRDVLHYYSGARVRFVNPFSVKRFQSIGKILYYDASEDTLCIEETIGDQVEIHHMHPERCDLELKPFCDFSVEDFKQLVTNLIGQAKGISYIVNEAKPKAKYRKLSVLHEGEPVAIFTLYWNWHLEYKDLKHKSKKFNPPVSPGQLIHFLCQMGYNVFFQ